jgi:hypothetical protein
MKAVRRLCVAVDLEGFSTLSPNVQALAQRRLRQLLHRAWRECGVRPHRVWQGDGEVALAPRGVDESRLVSTFSRAVRVALRRVNREPGPCRMRLRVGIHTGVAAASRAGLVGAGVVRACRLVNSAPLRAALVDNPRADVALIVSQALYEDVICAEEHEFTAADFVPVRVVIGEKSFSADAWVHVPDRVYRPEVDLAGLVAALVDRHARPAPVNGVGNAGAGASASLASQNHRNGDSAERTAPAS